MHAKWLHVDPGYDMAGKCTCVALYTGSRYLQCVTDKLCLLTQKCLHSLVLEYLSESLGVSLTVVMGRSQFTAGLLLTLCALQIYLLTYLLTIPLC